MPRPSGLRIEPRVNRAAGKTAGWTIAGYVAGQRVRRRAQSLRADLARKEAALLEAQILNTAWLGERPGVRSFAEAVVAYFEAEPRSAATKLRYNRILQALGNVKLGAIDQDTVTTLKKKLLRADHKPATATREIIAPLRAVMRLAQERGWCTAPRFRVPREAEGRTFCLLPAEVERLIAESRHLAPLLEFLIGTGARLGEALRLDWCDLDLTGARAIFWGDTTKSGKRRVAELPPRTVAVLANLKHREGRVFLTPAGLPYADKRGLGGGHIKTAFKASVKRAKLDPAISPHVLRHTWASWRWAIDRDLLRLKIEGAWSSVTLVERYAHVMPQGHEMAIRQFYGHLLGIEAGREQGNRLTAQDKIPARDHHW